MKPTAQLDHTALPWTIGKHRRIQTPAPSSIDGCTVIVGECELTQDNAEFIVRAANSYYDMQHTINSLRADNADLREALSVISGEPRQDDTYAGMNAVQISRTILAKREAPEGREAPEEGQP